MNGKVRWNYQLQFLLLLQKGIGLAGKLQIGGALILKIPWSPHYSNQCEGTWGTRTRGSGSICRLYSLSQSYSWNTLWLKLSEIDTVDSSTNTEFVKRADTAFSTSVIAIWPLPEVIPSNHLGTIFFFPLPFYFWRNSEKVSSDDSVLLVPASWQTGNWPLRARAPTQLWKT